ncbi:MAG: hypothetical protein WEC59_09655 [Salibacteraceae bacterium]
MPYPSSTELKKGAVALGYSFQLLLSSGNQEGIYVCASDFMLEDLIGKFPEAVQQLLDATDASMRLMIEKSPNQWMEIILDYEGLVGNFVMQLRQPIIVISSKENDSCLLKNGRNKVIPLPPDFEKAIQQLFASKNETIRFYKDGSFKLGRE